MDDDTIFAVASGGGRAAVSLMRITGPASGAILDALCGRRPPVRRASLRRLRVDGDVLDHALVLWLPGPDSYTGEDSAELHLHGGLAVRTDVADALVRLGARPAEAGEFTRRAFLNGRMDLLEAEAVADLVEAEGSEQRRQALRQMEGALGTLYQGWADRLRNLLADQEALIDFPDEGLPEMVEQVARMGIEALSAEIRTHLDDGRRGERLRDGLVFAVVGPPNAGKSSLVNALLQRDMAIVSPVPGTTRDVLEARVVLGGVPVTLLDTAGLREATDLVEAEGVRRARDAAGRADLILAVASAEDRAAPEMMTTGSAPVLRLTNKVDLAPAAEGIGVSARTGEGLDGLRDRLAVAARAMVDRAGPPPLTRARHRAALTEALAHLAEAREAAWADLRAEALRLAMLSLGRITGAVSAEDILGSIFSRFCIGK